MMAVAHAEFAPLIPDAIDDALYDALRGIVGSDLAFAAVDAVWDIITTQPSITVNRVVETPLCFALGLRARDPRPLR